MAIYHCTVKLISRSSGRSSVGASSYRSGEKIKNQNDGVTHDYTKRKDVAHTEILLPENAPGWMAKREKLWNAVEKSEKRKDAQTAREIEIALPAELEREKQLELVRKYAKENFVLAGMIADICIHDKGDGTPHAHIMLTTREVTPEGFTGKNRDWNNKKLLGTWRENWATLTNEALEKAGSLERVDHRTLEAQGIERPAEIRQGPAITAMERRGIVTEVGQYNRDLRELAKIDKKIAELQRDPRAIQYANPEAGETHPEKMPESPSKTPDKGGTLGFDGEIPVLGVKNALEAQKRLTARASEISAPQIAKYTEKRAEELLQLEKRIEKLEKEHREIRESEPKKKIFEFAETFAKRESEWQKAEKAARFACLDAWREKKEFAEVTQRGKNVLSGEANAQAREENPHLVKIIAEEKALKTEQEKQKRLERQHSRGNNRGR